VKVKPKLTLMNVSILLSVTTSIFILFHRINVADNSDHVSNPKIISNTVSGYDLSKKVTWQVIIFKNYECSACRLRINEFKANIKYEIRFANYIIPSMKLSLPAARIACIAKLLGKFDEVDNILLRSEKLTEQDINEAYSIVKNATESQKQLAKDEVAKDTILAAHLRVSSIPVLFAISPEGVIYQADSIQAINALISSKS
jgi:hypothetical protein